ncbi:unnamed protein product [Adineta steineri]|uniref:Uncharacterized protein n=1 Tax=Adineta steineri TaxID=433720 RepID=A0A815JPZ6_9BILA|nr:unnamed protein product [Adineta steineri]CAF3865409.1 unnamed protein product [Adineta steineri]
MNYIIENTTVTTLNTSNLNVQSYEINLLSSTHSLVEQQNLDMNNNNQSYQAHKKNNKLCYGNRKILFAKRRVHCQQEKLIINQTNHLNHHIIKTDGNDRDNVQTEEEQQIQTCSLNDQRVSRLSNKRKYHELNQDETQLDLLFSQLTISQENLRKKKRLTRSSTSSFMLPLRTCIVTCAKSF